MDGPILVTGGAGTLGRQVVALLRTAGAPVRVLSRKEREPGDGVEFVVGDLETGAGVDGAVKGVDTIVHCAGTQKGDGDKVRTLIRALDPAAVRHLVNVSVVGADRVPVRSGFDRALFGYYASKLDAEDAVAGSGLPWTTLRATQFHDLALMFATQLAKLPIVPVPAGMRIQPVDSGEVAARLVELAFGAPAGLAPDITGPRVYALGDLVRSYLRARGKRRVLVPVRFGGGAYRALRAGANLAPDRAVGVRTWEEFLAERTGQRVLGGLEHGDVAGAGDQLQRGVGEV